jgi:CheY-like chemotaxis protein
MPSQESVPAASAALVPSTSPDEIVALPVPAATPGPDASTILVVEDDPQVRAVLVRVLGRTYTVFAAADGPMALDLLTRIPTPAALVFDVMIPGLDGISLAKRVKDHPRLQQVPIVFVTASNLPGAIVDGINAGARHYVTKPFRIEDLLAKIGASIAGAREPRKSSPAIEVEEEIPPRS